MSGESENELRNGAPVCPVVEVVPAQPFGHKKVAHSDDLPQSALDDLAAGINKRGSDRVAIAHSIMNKYRLAGLVVLWNVSKFGGALWKKTGTPLPFLFAFPPIELDDRNPKLVALYNDSRDVRCPRLHPTTRWLMLYYWAILVFVVYVVISAGQHWSLGKFCAIAAVGIFAAAKLVTDTFRRAWVLVPGGVLVRQGRLSRSRVGARSYRRADAVLVVGPGWATVYARGQREYRMLSSLETAALLAAWLSPAAGGAEKGPGAI
jgi:hypothetical protein